MPSYSSLSVTIDGETRTAREWCRIRKLSWSAVKMRIARLGWSPLRAVTTPVRPMRRRINGDAGRDVVEQLANACETDVRRSGSLGSQDETNPERQAVIWIAWNLLRCANSRVIGEVVGQRSHSSVLEAAASADGRIRRGSRATIKIVNRLLSAIGRPPLPDEGSTQDRSGCPADPPSGGPPIPDDPSRSRIHSQC